MLGWLVRDVATPLGLSFFLDGVWGGFDLFSAEQGSLAVFQCLCCVGPSLKALLVLLLTYLGLDHGI